MSFLLIWIGFFQGYGDFLFVFSSFSRFGGDFCVVVPLGRQTYSQEGK